MATPVVPRSIALFAPNASAFYFNCLLCMRKELVRRGIDTHVGWGYLNPSQMAQFCDGFRPDVVLEIDRTRNRSPGVPVPTKHAAWLQDWRSVSAESTGRSNASFGGSDFYFFCTRPEAIGIDATSLSNWGYLLLGTDPEVFFPEEVGKESDFSLMGYIPPRDKLGLAQAPLRIDLTGIGPSFSSTRLGTVGELVDAMQVAGLSWNTYNVTESYRFIREYVLGRSLALRLFSTIGGSLFLPDPLKECIIPDDFLYEIENNLLRALSRKYVADSVLRVSKSVRLFGYAGWDTYPEFAPYFCGPLLTEQEVRRMFLTTTVNLHNAMSQVHARVLDCMATGSAILVNEIYGAPDSPDSLSQTMEAGTHYFEYNDSNLPEVSERVLRDHELRRKAARAAREVVLARHCWSHRVDSMLSDLSGM